MKPQLIIQDMGGVNNADLEGSKARLMKGGSWKQQRIIVVLPSADVIPAKVALSYWNLAFPPNNGVLRILATGQEVGIAYSNALEAILADPNLSQWEYFLTCEHDNAPEPGAVIKLLERMEERPDLSAISGGYWTKGPNGVFQAWGDKKDPVVNFRPQLPDPNGGLVECYGIGMGFALFRLNMFKDPKLRRPWFKTQIHGGVSTQDLFFWSDAAKYGYKCAVDCSVKVGHYDLEGKFSPIQDMMW